MALFRKFLKFRHRDRAPRVLVIPLHEISFVCDEPNFQDAEIHDISTSGLSLSGKSMPKTPYIGQIVRATVKTPEDEQTVELEVRHAAGGKIGLMVIGNAKSFSHLVSSYLNSEIEAVSMKELPQDNVTQHPNGHTRVWEDEQREGDCSLYLVVAPDGDVVLFQLGFFGNIIAGGRTGDVLLPIKKRISASHTSSSSMLSPELRDSLIKFLASIQGMPKTAFEQIEFILYHKTLAA